MPNTRTVRNESKAQTQDHGTESTIEVLYQKMGAKWFAFSLVNEEVFVGSISESELEGKNETPKKVSRTRNQSGTA